MLGHVFETETAGYRSWGYADMDGLFGNIWRFYDDDLLDRYAAISTHANFLSGHLAVFKTRSDTARLSATKTPVARGDRSTQLRAVR